MRENFDEYVELVNEYLVDYLPRIDSKSSTLYDAMKYSLTAGGKRLRSVLVLAACEFAGGIRLLKQDLWEMIVSFLISQQNSCLICHISKHL